LRGRAPTPQGHASGICPEGSDRSNGSGVAGAGKAGPVWGLGHHGKPERLRKGALRSESQA